MLESSVVRVVERRDTTKQACHLPTRRVTVLDDPQPESPFSSPAVLAGALAISDRFVGYTWSSSSRDGSIVRVKVLDARARKVVTNVSAYTGASIQDVENTAVDTDLVLDPTGAVAWAVTPPPYLGTRQLRLAARGARRSTLLASSPDIEPGSVTLNRSYVYWRQAGVTLSAPR